MKLQIILDGIPQVDSDVDCLDMETNIGGDISLSAKRQPIKRDTDIPTGTPWTDPFTYERLDGRK